MPNWPNTGNWPTTGSWPSGISWPGSGSFNGNFASLFTGVLQSVQTDLGLTYGGAMLTTGTTVVATTLTGSLATNPVPITVKVAAGSVVGITASFNIYYDGGTTPAMAGVVPAAATPFPLTGAGTGLSITLAAGAVTPDFVAVATCAGLADQAPTPHNFSQATLANQPIITAGLNGFCGLVGDGVNTEMSSTFVTPTPGATPTYLYVVGRMRAKPGANACIYGAAGGIGTGIFCASGTLNIVEFAGTALANPTLAVLNSWYGMSAAFTNSASDFMKLGSAAAVFGAGAGNAGGTMMLFKALASFPAPVEILAAIASSTPMPATLPAAVLAKYGVSVSV